MVRADIAPIFKVGRAAMRIPPIVEAHMAIDSPSELVDSIVSGWNDWVKGVDDIPWKKLSVSKG